MTKSQLMFLFINVALSTQVAFAQVDYYSKCDTIKGEEIEYNVTHERNWIFIENVNNQLSSEPIIWTDTGQFAMGETRPGAGRDEKKIRSIVRRVFTRKEIRKYTKSKTAVEIGVAIDSKTGKSLEVGFTIENFESFNDPILLSIPISKFEKLEQLIKEELLWKVYPGSQAASYIGLSITLFWGNNRE